MSRRGVASEGFCSKRTSDPGLRKLRFSEREWKTAATRALERMETNGKGRGERVGIRARENAWAPMPPLLTAGNERIVLDSAPSFFFPRSARAPESPRVRRLPACAACPAGARGHKIGRAACRGGQ